MVQIALQGTAGRLEARYERSKQAGSMPIALFLHPHPVYGGTMNSKVLYRLFQIFHQKGFSCLRFNFRGVGQSDGHFDNGAGELMDAAVALDWLENNNHDHNGCWLIGFSYGAYIAAQLLMRRPEVTNFIMVAPPSNMFDFAFLSPCPTVGLFLHGSDDKIVPISYGKSLFNRVKLQTKAPIEQSIIQGAGHFFDNYFEDLEEVVSDYLSRHHSGNAKTIYSDLGLT